MYRSYLVLGALVLCVFAYAQFQGWSVHGSDAQAAARSQGRGGTGSTYSGHK